MTRQLSVADDQPEAAQARAPNTAAGAPVSPATADIGFGDLHFALPADHPTALPQAGGFQEQAVPGPRPPDTADGLAMGLPGGPMAGANDSPFRAMPEIMPPPPLRPVLPPDLQSEPEKRSLIARLLGGMSS